MESQISVPVRSNEHLTHVMLKNALSVFVYNHTLYTELSLEEKANVTDNARQSFLCFLYLIYLELHYVHVHTTNRKRVCDAVHRRGKGKGMQLVGLILFFCAWCSAFIA